MKKLQLVIELEYDDTLMHGDDKDAIRWFYDLLLNPIDEERLLLFSTEAGDYIGNIIVDDILE